ncbi:MAG: hypothetical protein A4E53_03494 [Pelotomaculum sp. PtaB.Bin104]|nr:MAG: hypothetical protein A4E53_03494 [Pelotomaculum sp. PtaB.Bin104]
MVAAALWHANDLVIGTFLVINRLDKEAMMLKQIENKKTYLIFGRVTNKRTQPLSNLLVRAYDRDLRSEELLGECITGKNGQYAINWLPDKLSEGRKKEADIAVKVFTREKKTLLFASNMDSVRFGASEREEINITIEAAVKPEVVEYDHILQEAGLIANRVAISDLQENEQHRDITFISREAGIPQEQLEHLVVAHRLQAASRIDAAFFYALLRKNTLLKKGFAEALHVRLAVDINTEIQPLLYEAVLTDLKTIQRDLNAAVKEMIVPAIVKEECKENYEQLQQYKQEAADYYQNEHPRKVLNLVSRFIGADKVDEIEKLFQENKHDISGFLKKITNGSFFKNIEAAKETEVAGALGELLGFDETIITHVKESQKIKKPEDIRKLVALNKAGWQEVLAKSADKMKLAGKTLDKKLIEHHASALARKMEKEYPTVAFSAQLAREEKSIFKNQAALKEFFTKHEDFDLQRHNIDLFLKEKKMTAGADAAMLKELKSVQRIFKLIPHYSKTNALLKQNISSAQSIAAAGETRFLKQIAPKAGISAKEARAIFRRAERTTTAAMLVIGKLQDTIRDMDIPAIRKKSLAKKLEAVSKDFPNLKTLFQLTDLSACDPGRSVLSPAAYLVEILEFLDNRSVTDLTLTPPDTGPWAKDILFERRPDLGDIDLGSENAQTPLPYIDLVCELLEEAVSPDPGISYTGKLSDGTDPLKGKIAGDLLAALQSAGWPVTDQAQVFETETDDGTSANLPHYLRDNKAVCKIISKGGDDYHLFRLRQTLGTAEELAAAPEYVNTEAYKALKSARYAFKLPFDIAHTEAKAYFTRFGVERHTLMADFQVAGNPAGKTIAAEKLGLTKKERELIVTPRPDISDQQLFWNAPPHWDTDPVVHGNVLEYMKRVDHFLDKTGISYQELDLLLSLMFIDPGKKLFIKHNYDNPSAANPTISADTSKKEIAHLDIEALDRIHRFLRLQKKTGWKFEVLDEIISQEKLGKKKLDDDCLIKAADLAKLSEETGIKLEELIGFYGEIPYQVLNDNESWPLYQQVFLNKAKAGYIDEGLLPEKINGSLPLDNFKTSISVCLQISEQDFEQLSRALPDGSLNFANLSYLFAAARLMRKLKLKAEDLVILAQLTGSNIQDSPQATLAFVKAVKASQKLPLRPAEILFLLRHEGNNLAELKDDKIKQVLEKVQADLQKAFAANLSPFDPGLSADEQKECLQNLLSKLTGLEEDDVKKLINYIDRDWNSAADAKAFVDDQLGYVNKVQDLRRDGFDTSAIKTQIDLLAAAAGPDISAERNALVKAFVDTITAYQFNVDKKTILAQHLVTAFKADNEQLNVVLKYAKLKQTPGAGLISDVLSSDMLIDTDISHPAPVLPVIDNVAFSVQYETLRLLHKLLPLIESFKLETTELEWFFKNNHELTWFELDAIPYQQPGQTPVDYQKYAAFAEMLAMAKQLSPVPDPADPENPVTFLKVAEMLLPGSTAARDELIEKISLLTGYAKEAIEAVDQHLFPAFSLEHYRAVDTWEVLIKCLEHLRKLGITVEQAIELIKPSLTGEDTKQLRMALKARYDEDTWLGTLKEIMDAIRPQKRNALVAYLLAVNPEMKDENDLYDYFLIDVEMEAGMPSSRIVQAHGTIQLFVQRCLMGLEPKAAADIVNDHGWEQWKWMKNYRVWEANRKVFLYPENWIEAELRDDKSFLFTELENELQQNELTDYAAEEALVRYLEKLDNIAFLEVMATWYQSDIKTMHVFARTKGGDPALYYYRKFEQERYWTPWEKVELDITGDHLLAFVRNNRLCLAWPVFSEEADPEPKAKLPDQSITTEQAVDKPKRKLKIQLAISEFANKKWQPKKISKDGILTPSDYFTDDENVLRRDKYNLMYFEIGHQVFLFHSDVLFGEYEYPYLNGVFNIAGCKGYPELIFQGNKLLPDFLPDFRDTWLNSQRYKEVDVVPPNDLAVRNGISLLNFYEILNKTPGTFRLTYPHQLTKIDLLVLLVQYLMKYIHSNKINLTHAMVRSIKIPLGTLLPYFMEDSSHAYVIIPGFYEKKRKFIRPDREVKENVIFTGLSTNEVDPVKRSGSDVMQLIEDIIALIKGFVKYQAAPDPEQLTELIDDFQKIVAELKVYGGLRYGEAFKNMYHPLVCPLRTTLYRGGVSELMKRETQLQQNEKFDFEAYYSPANVVPKTYLQVKDKVETLSYPVEDIDFTTEGSYSCYNWELFFHVPFLIATRLTKNQRFEEALSWFHYMFNPTGALDGTAPQKYWVTKPFYLTHDEDYVNQRIDTLLYKIADQTTSEIAELENAIEQWRNKPFKPHVVARFRPVAYQKALLMKYIDNLTEWGDYLFRQDTMESIAQATQMYILADKLLGPKPRLVPPAIKAPNETYNQIKGKLDAFGNALIELENILPDLSALPEGGAELPPAPVTLSTLYFCIPQNEQMLAYWDRIADRLFKIRHCQNIDGVERSLALFAPPIDPGMLVRAAASGLDISAVLAGMNAPAPYYRFNILSQKATELAQEVRGLGSSLLQTLEKKDAEAMSLLRSELELKVLNAVKDMKLLQIEEAKEQIEILKRTKEVTEERNKYYSDIPKIIAKEQLNLDKLSEAQDYQLASQIVRTVAGALALIPEMHLGVNGFGGSPEVVFQIGGSAISRATSIGADILNILSSVASYEANQASILGGYERRFDDWKLQERLANKELAQIDKQIAAAEVRKEIAETDLRNHELQIENARKTDEFMRSKFTNKELYDWTAGQISAVYFKAYQLAFDLAKKAERSYRFELGSDDSFIQYGYWDSVKKGLQSADHLIHDIKRMETSYLDKNKREYELTKHVSLAMLDPLALAKLKSTGACDFEIPEALFDMDHAGHYFRRIKSVSISLPCIAGPYTSISAKLSLVSNRYRKNTNPDNGSSLGYIEDLGNDERFVYNVGAIQSIAASSAQNDSGVFELNFRDERYLPFEGAGAISSWRLELPREVRQFDYNTIADVILHLKYTAREGGSTLRGLAETTLKECLAAIKQQLDQSGLHVAINMKHDCPNEWHLFKKNGAVDLKIDKSRLPYMAQTLDAAIENVVFLAKVNNNPAGFTIEVNNNEVGLSRIDEWRLCRGSSNAVVLDTPFELSAQAADLDELMMIVKYSF